MVGYLVAGFVLHAFGAESSDAIEEISEIGILLLLFGIGLKLKVETLAQPVVWAGASLHMAVTAALAAAITLGIGLTGLPIASGLSLGQALLIGFAFSFSSTVFAVKALQERNESNSLQGANAIGILVVQDIFAVAFLTLAVDEPPLLLAIPVLLIVLAGQPIYWWLLDRSGHGELLLLFGLALAVGLGAQAFDSVGLKADLGALLVGFTLAKHPRANELSDTLLDFKDILLIGFFLSIGLNSSVGVPEVVIAVALLGLLPLQAFGFLALGTRFGYRARTSWHMAISLATYSEFGLIVGVIGIERGIIDERWSAVFAIAVALSFMVAAPVSSARYTLYGRFREQLLKLERDQINPLDALLDPGHADILIFGMGRTGIGAYDEFVEQYDRAVLGVDRRQSTVDVNTNFGRNVVRGDALDPEFWEQVAADTRIELVVFAMNDHEANLASVRQMRTYLPDVPIAAAATHADEVAELIESGVSVARDILAEAGQGLADDAVLALKLDQ